MREEEMKKLSFGIGILLFAILLKLCSSGMDNVALIIGLIGLCFLIIGYLDNSK
jgi:hypothetical protein